MMNRLDYLIEYLLKEDPQYSEMEIPSDLQGKRDLFRALRNVRWPKPISDEFLRFQDEELQEQLQEKGIVELDAVRQFSIFNSQFSYNVPTLDNPNPLSGQSDALGGLCGDGFRNCTAGDVMKHDFATHRRGHGEFSVNYVN